MCAAYGAFEAVSPGHPARHCPPWQLPHAAVGGRCQQRDGAFLSGCLVQSGITDTLRVILGFGVWEWLVGWVGRGGVFAAAVNAVSQDPTSLPWAQLQQAHTCWPLVLGWLSETSALLFVPVSMLRPCLLLIQGILRWHLYHTSYCLLWSVFLQTLVPVVARQGLSHLRHLL